DFRDFKEGTPARSAAEKYQAAVQAMDGKDAAVPDAPFKKTWHEFVLKRLIREAAEKGYDKIAWTPGEAQAERYDLSKKIDAIKLTDMKPANGEGFHLVAYDHDGHTVFDKRLSTP